MDLLQVVEFATPGISRGVNVADNVVSFLQPAQDFTVHDLRMLDIKQQLEPGWVHLTDQARDLAEVIPPVALHGVVRHTAVEVLHTDSHAIHRSTPYLPHFSMVSAD